VAALWYTNRGESTGKAAIVAGAKCVYLTHVLQSDDLANKLRLLLAMIGHLVVSVKQSVTYPMARTRHRDVCSR
jgi:hypothetical protein